MQQHPFVCDHCGRAFRTEHTLTIHVRKHTGTVFMIHTSTSDKDYKYSVVLSENT